MKATLRKQANNLKNDYSCELLTPFKKALQKHIDNIPFQFKMYIHIISFLPSKRYTRPPTCIVRNTLQISSEDRS